jgi:polar amino acid transport system substrate-binding protein
MRSTVIRTDRLDRGEKRMTGLRQRRRLAAVVALVGLTALGLTACASKSQSSGGILPQIKKSKVLVAGSLNDPPVSYQDPSTGQPEGIVPDLLRAALDRNGMQDVKIKLVDMPFVSVIPAIQAKRIDIQGDIMGITPARQKVISYVDPFFINPETVVVAKGNPKNIHAWTDMKGKKCGTWEGSIWADWCAELGDKNIRTYPTPEEMFQDIALGRIDGGFVDAVTVAGALIQNPSLASKIQAASPYTLRGKATEVSLGINKSFTDLRDLLSNTFKQMKDDGSMAKIFAKYGMDPKTSIAM